MSMSKQSKKAEETKKPRFVRVIFPRDATPRQMVNAIREAAGLPPLETENPQTSEN